MKFVPVAVLLLLLAAAAAAHGAPLAVPLTEGDIIVAGRDATGPNLFVLNGTTFELKGTIGDSLTPDVCNFTTGAFSISPDWSTILVLCSSNDSRTNASALVTLNATDYSIMTIVPGEEEEPVGELVRAGTVVYQPSGGLYLGYVSSVSATLLSLEDGVASFFSNFTVQYDASMGPSTNNQVSTLNSMDISANGSLLLYTDRTNLVAAFNVKTQENAFVYFTPSKGYCTSVVALYDNHAAQDSLVACVVPDIGFCVYRTNTDGKMFGRTWCTPAFNSSATTIAGSSINIALDIDRRSYVATIDDKSDTSATRPNVFRVRINGKSGVYQLLSAGLQDLTLDGTVKVFGAILASQQKCSKGHCCAPNGLVFNANTPCLQRDPCILPGMCDGVNSTCPTQGIAEHGTLCSRHPWGLFKPAPVDKYITAEEAEAAGYHKCGMCSFGTCVPPKEAYRGRHSGRSLMENQLPAAAASVTPAGVVAAEGSYGSEAEVQGHKHKGWAWCMRDRN